MANNRYVFLDGIRGIAALFVVIRHTPSLWNFEFYRSYLAVDLFFILSGFVIGHAYEKKLVSGEISTQRFFQLRLIRLYPIFILSVAITAGLAVAGFYLQHPKDMRFPDGFTSTIVLMAFLVPAHSVASYSLYAMNVPYWSLAFELVANVIYGFVRPFLNNKVLLSCVAILVCLEFMVSNSAGSINQGFTWGAASLMAGAVRSLYGISMGFLLYRNQDRVSDWFKRPAMPWIAVVAVCLVLGSPDLGGVNALADFIAVTLIFPACVSIAAQGTSRFVRPLTILGTASYGIYMFHYPMAEFLANLNIHVQAPISGFCFLIGVFLFAVIADRLYDAPVRRWLSSRRKQESTSVQSAASSCRIPRRGRAGVPSEARERQ